MEPLVIQAATRVSLEEQGIHQAYGTHWADSKVVWAAEGLTVTRGSYEDREGVTIEYDDIEYDHEYAPVRPFTFKDLRAGIVAAIGGQNYMIRIEVHSEDDDNDVTGAPLGATVVFIPTGRPETPWTPWDEASAKAEALANLRRDTEQMKADAKNAEWDKEFITGNERMIADIESGKRRLRPRGDVLLFGKPNFIQIPIFPAHNGKAAWCLAVLETGWGDCGNVNLLFTTDADGRPNKVWFEASCC